MNKLLILSAVVMLCACAEKKTDESEVNEETKEMYQKWSYEDAKQYNSNQFEDTKWDLEILESELNYVDTDPWPTQPPMNKLPFPVAKYGAGYNGYSSKAISLQIADKTIMGGSFAVATNQYSIEPKHNPNKSNFIFFTILVLTDMPDSENSALSVLSRNYPHHTCQGRRKTSIGHVDWFAMHLASGEKFATVSTKYFNLEFGQTILVAPQKDGSLRFKQMDLPDLSTNEIDEEISKFEANQDVITFFTMPTNI